MRTEIKVLLFGLLLGLHQASWAGCGDFLCMLDDDCWKACQDPTSGSCGDAPQVSIVTPAMELNVGRDQLVTLTVAGSITNQLECTITRVWFELTDEYSEMDKEESVDLGTDGTYSLSVPIQATRRGKDKDGRLYQLTVYAENEAGVGTSPVYSANVDHDNR